MHSSINVLLFVHVTYLSINMCAIILFFNLFWNNLWNYCREKISSLLCDKKLWLYLYLLHARKLHVEIAVVDICRNEADKNEIYRSARVEPHCRAGGKTFGGSPDRA